MALGGGCVGWRFRGRAVPGSELAQSSDEFEPDANAHPPLQPAPGRGGGSISSRAGVASTKGVAASASLGPACSGSLRRFFWAYLAAGGGRGVKAIYAKMDGREFNSIWTSIVYDFGLEPRAHISVDLVNRYPANNTYLMLLNFEQWEFWTRFGLQPLSPNGIGDAKGAASSYMLSHWRKEFQGRVFANFYVDAPRSDRYYLGVFNARHERVVLDGVVSMLNPGPEHHLPVQQRHLPHVLFLLSMLFLATCGVFLVMFLLAPRRTRSQVHLLMATVVLLKGAVLLLRGHDRRCACAWGASTVISNFTWRFLDVLQTIAELLMFLFLALGWRILRRRLSPLEKKFVRVLCTVSFTLGFLELLSGEGSSRTASLNLTRYILHSMCYLVIVASNCNVQLIHAQLQESTVGEEAGKLYWKLQCYVAFRWIVHVWIAAPTLELLAGASLLPWDGESAFVLLTSLRTWVIYVCMLGFFRPGASPPKVLQVAIASADTVVQPAEAELAVVGGEVEFRARASRESNASAGPNASAGAV